ncbi:hypothetical protein POM88_031179 [Heracleum sosnowskyi]|uniref:Uncharacterized protein n=1 Tax=Heracleum sosnowskyi TaxID=360622 RepID=A0AAD8MIW5_9APIA|nr:hypothetical protein POM88_031179 [Heracleum sosnowskyi]
MSSAFNHPKLRKVPYGQLTVKEKCDYRDQHISYQSETVASSTSDMRPYRLVVNKEWENIELGGDEWEGGGYSEAADKEQGRTKKFTARKRVKQILVDEESEEEYEGSEVGSEESEEEDSDFGDERREDCSDLELFEMRKVREEIRKENEALEQQQSQFIRDTLRQFGSKYNDYNSHSTGGSLDELYYEDSEDEDEEVAYAEPPAHSKKQRLGNGFGYTFISDQQNGLEKAVK